MDEQELERLVRQTYGEMPVPPLRARTPARRGIPLAGVAAIAAAIVIGIAIGTALPRLRASPATAPPASGPYAVLFAEGSTERFAVVDPDGTTLATLDRGSTLSVSAVTPSPDGRLVAYWRGSVTDAELLVWEVATAQIRPLFRSGERVGGPILWAPDSRSFVTAVSTHARGPDVPPQSARVLRVQTDGTIAELMRLTDAQPPLLVAYDGSTAAGLFGRVPDVTYGLITHDGQRIMVRGVGAPLPTTFANPPSQDGGVVAGNFKEFESVGPNDIRVWQLERFDPPLARHLERGGEGALLWPGRRALLFVNFSGPSQAMLKALRYDGPQRIEELGATDGVPLAFDPSGRWLLTSGPSVHPIVNDAVGTPRRLPVTLPMRAIGWVASGAVTRSAPPTPAPPSCERPGTSPEDVLRAFFDEVRGGDVGGMIDCWVPGGFAFANASAYTRTRLLDLGIERFGSEGRDQQGRLVLGFRVRASWELRERSPWRTDGGCCERVFLVRQVDPGGTTWRLESSQTVSAKVPPDACAARTGLRPEQTVETWFTLLADERADDMVACWTDGIPDRAALMRGYLTTGGATRLEIGPATPTRSGAVAVQVVVDWRVSGGAWSSGETKWLIVRQQPDGRWAIESTATALVPDAQ